MLRRLRPPRRRRPARPLRPPQRPSPPPRHLALVQPRGREHSTQQARRRHGFAEQLHGRAPAVAASRATSAVRSARNRGTTTGPRPSLRPPTDGRAAWHHFTTLEHPPGCAPLQPHGPAPAAGRSAGFRSTRRSAPAQQHRRRPATPPERGPACDLRRLRRTTDLAALSPPAAPAGQPTRLRLCLHPPPDTRHGIAPPPRHGPPTVDTMEQRCGCNIYI